MKKLTIELEVTIDDELMKESGVSIQEILDGLSYEADDEIDEFIHNIEGKVVGIVSGDAPTMQHEL